MDKLIKEIFNSLESKNYLSALALTLILPDICSEIEFPELKRENKKRYVEWYNKYIYNIDTPKELKSIDKFDGEAIYKLRCAFLHDGSTNIESHIEKKYDKKTIDFTFELTDNFTSYSKSWAENEDENSIRIRIGVNEFCKKICSVAHNYYDEHSKKDIFNDIIILGY